MSEGKHAMTNVYVKFITRVTKQDMFDVSDTLCGCNFIKLYIKIVFGV